MKTLTEFSAPHIKLASLKQKEFAAAGKNPEEIPALIGAELKIEGDRLTFLMSVLEIIGTKTLDIKRVVVSTVDENEKVPNPKLLKDGKYFLAEYYPPLVQKNHKGRDGFRGKGGKGPRDKKRRFGRGRRDNRSADAATGQNQTRDRNDRNRPAGGEGQGDRENKKFDPSRARRPWRGKAPGQGDQRTNPKPVVTPAGPPRVHVPIEPPTFVPQPKPSQEPTST
jgi:hypothetical protein